MTLDVAAVLSGFDGIAYPADEALRVLTRRWQRQGMGPWGPSPPLASPTAVQGL